MKVYFVRHGQSEGNLTKVHQDGKVKLSHKGLEQAKDVAKRFKNIKVDVILSSDYVRAFTTAGEIAKVTGHDVIPTELLREIKKPTEIEGKKHSDPDAISIRQQILENQHKPEWRFSDEENFFDVAGRAKHFLKELEKRSEESVVCVAHGNIIGNIIMTMVIGDLYSSAIYGAVRKTMCLENTGLTVCEFTDKQWRLLTWNDYAHLG